MSETKPKRWWISWHQPTEDYRPLRYPPHNPVMGWWCSGHADVAILCAVVLAEDETEARANIIAEWPEAERWRFCEEKPDGWVPGDRFPVSGWMAERFGFTEPRA